MSALKLIKDYKNASLRKRLEMYDVDEILGEAESTITTLEARVAELENPWVSVEERLPELGELVLIVYSPIMSPGKRLPHLARFRGESDPEGGQWFFNHHDNMVDVVDRVTKWSRLWPLPPIPKEAEE